MSELNEGSKLDRNKENRKALKELVNLSALISVGFFLKVLDEYFVMELI